MVPQQQEPGQFLPVSDQKVVADTLNFDLVNIKTFCPKCEMTHSGRVVGWTEHLLFVPPTFYGRSLCCFFHSSFFSFSLLCFCTALWLPVDGSEVQCVGSGYMGVEAEETPARC